MPRLTEVLGSESDARFCVGELLQRHRTGYFGQVSLEDRAINEYVIREHVLRGTSHLVLSVHEVQEIAIAITTHLGEKRTCVRLRLPVRVRLHQST